MSNSATQLVREQENPKSKDEFLLDARWIGRLLLTRAKEGGKKWASQKDKIIWSLNKKGKWVQVPGDWGAIDRNGVNGLSLREFRDEHRLNNNWSREALKLIIKLHRESENQWPNSVSKTIWGKDGQGRWLAIPGSWSAVDKALVQGYCGFEKGSCLSEFKKENGFTRNTTEPVPLRIAVALTEAYMSGLGGLYQPR